MGKLPWTSVFDLICSPFHVELPQRRINGLFRGPPIIRLHHSSWCVICDVSVFNKDADVFNNALLLRNVAHSHKICSPDLYCLYVVCIKVLLNIVCNINIHHLCTVYSHNNNNKQTKIVLKSGCGGKSLTQCVNAQNVMNNFLPPLTYYYPFSHRRYMAAFTPIVAASLFCVNTTTQPMVLLCDLVRIQF